MEKKRFLKSLTIGDKIQIIVEIKRGVKDASETSRVDWSTISKDQDKTLKGQYYWKLYGYVILIQKWKTNKTDRFIQQIEWNILLNKTKYAHRI